MYAALVALTLLAATGIAWAVLPPRANPSVAPSRHTTARLAQCLLPASGVGLVVLLASGWLLPAVVVAIGTFWAIRGWQGRHHRGDRELARLDALASWIENVRDVLLAGEQPIGAIAATVSACPPVIRPQVRRLSAGLGRQDPEVVFRRFADELDDPLGDLVAAGLSVAVRRGARTGPVLTALAEQARQQVDRRRLVEAERAPARREVKALIVIMSGLILALLVFGRSEYLTAYDEPEGQLFLAAALAGYAGLIVRVQRLAVFPGPSRFLTLAPVLGGAEQGNLQ